MKDDQDQESRIRSGDALRQLLGDFRVTSWDGEQRALWGAFTVRREFCHTNATIAQGGFVTGWLDMAMAHAVQRATDHGFNVASLEIKVSFLEAVGPGEGKVLARIARLGKRIAFLEGELFNPLGKLAARASSTALLVPTARPATDARSA